MPRLPGRQRDGPHPEGPLPACDEAERSATARGRRASASDREPASAERAGRADREAAACRREPRRGIRDPCAGERALPGGSVSAGPGHGAAVAHRAEVARRAGRLPAAGVDERPRRNADAPADQRSRASRGEADPGNGAVRQALDGAVVPVDLPAQGCVRSVGGGGGTGAQARPAPPTVARHVPAIEKSPSASAFPSVTDSVRVQSAPSARPAHAPVCAGDGAQSSGLAGAAPPSAALIEVPPSLAAATSPAPIAAALAGGLVPPSHPSRSHAAQKPARAVMEIESSRARIGPTPSIVREVPLTVGRTRRRTHGLTGNVPPNSTADTSHGRRARSRDARGFRPARAHAPPARGRYPGAEAP